MGSSMQLLNSAIELRSTYPRWLSGPSASSTANHRKGITPISLLTRRSTSSSPMRTSRGAELPLPHVAAACSPFSIRAAPTCFRKTDPR